MAYRLSLGQFSRRVEVLLEQFRQGLRGRPVGRLLARAAAANYLTVSVDVLDQLARHGYLRRRVLPCTHCVRFDVRDLDRVIEES